MLIKVVLIDINPKMIKAWKETFEENPEVEILQGSMLDQKVSAYVSPTNARGSMDGGLDGVLKSHFGAAIETRVQQKIGQNYHGQLPVGHATVVPTGKDVPKYLISTPTMVGSSDDISDTMNVALACAAAFQAVHIQNNEEPGSVTSVALPGLGANTGRVPVEICADLMWSGYNLFRRRWFADFAEMRSALEAELGDLGPSTKKGKKATAAKAEWGASAGMPVDPKTGELLDEEPEDADEGEKKDEDFDDYE